ncbi:MAG: hypothetical protein ACPG5B_06285 [Chitinophagales bacterium]
MKLIDTVTQKEFEAQITEVERIDYKIIKANKQFDFEWSKEQFNHVFKLVRANSNTNEILGLISLIDIPKELRIYVSLLESSKNNRGKHKKVDKIAGCLLAFATQVSFEKGYLGFISLIPKTALIKLYVEKYGFSRYGRQLAIEGKASVNLIQKYL